MTYFKNYKGERDWKIEEVALHNTYRSYYLYQTPICSAELFAIGKGCDYILDNFDTLKVKNLAFMVDSQGALQKLFAPFIQSKLVLQVKHKVNAVANQIGKPVVFKYIRAHMADGADPNSRLAKQFAGSTAADLMAKAGSRQSDYPKVNQVVLDEEVPLWPLSEIKRRLFDKIKIEWKNRWCNNADGSPRCKATKNFLPTPNTQFWKLLCTEKGNNRLFFSELVFCITNHNYLPAYEHKIDPNIDENCFLCND